LSKTFKIKIFGNKHLTAILNLNFLQSNFLKIIVRFILLAIDIVLLHWIA